MGADVNNDFLSSDNIEKHWISAGPKFGSEQGKLFIVIRSLYGLKSKPADTDVWLRPEIKPDGE